MSTATVTQAPTVNGKNAASAHVFTRPPVALADGCHLVSWSRRSTKANPVAEAERYRGIIIEASAVTVPPDACGSKFLRLVQHTINGLADAMFTAWAKDNIHATSYDGASITTDSVLTYWAEQRQRETIDAAAITEWLKQSATLASFDNEKQRAAWLAIMPKLAAPGYRGALKPDQASTAILRIKEEDTDHAVCAFIMQRLTNIMTPAEDANADAL